MALLGTQADIAAIQPLSQNWSEPLRFPVLSSGGREWDDAARQATRQLKGAAPRCRRAAKS